MKKSSFPPFPKAGDSSPLPTWPHPTPPSPASGLSVSSAKTEISALPVDPHPVTLSSLLSSESRETMYILPAPTLSITETPLHPSTSSPFYESLRPLPQLDVERERRRFKDALDAMLAALAYEPPSWRNDPTYDLFTKSKPNRYAPL